MKMKKKIKSLVKRAIPFIVALFVFVMSFCFSAFGAKINNVAFNEYFTANGSSASVGNNGADLGIFSSGIDVLYNFSSAVHIINVNLKVDEQYSSIPYHLSCKFDFIIKNASSDLYFQGGDFASENSARLNLVGGNSLNGNVTVTEWGYTIVFDFAERFVQVESFSFSFAVCSRNPLNSIGFSLIPETSFISALTDTQQNTNTIINGWTPNTSVDQSTTDDFVTKEDEVHNQIRPGLDDAAQIVGGLQDNIQTNDLNLYEGLLASTQLMNFFIDESYGIKPLYLIIGASLSLGLFAFVLGMIQMLNKIGRK